MANICEDEVPDEFWGGVYNIGGGADWRLTNWQLQTGIADALGVADVRRWYDRNWFATRNFHGQWYTDPTASNSSCRSAPTPSRRHSAGRSPPTPPSSAPARSPAGWSSTP
ncbi:hypothetical protein ACU686_25055 [Yinghuangia aomiensis]